MNHFVVELPVELQAEVARLARQKLGGESAWVADAVREKLEACQQLEYLESRATRGSRSSWTPASTRTRPAGSGRASTAEQYPASRFFSRSSPWRDRGRASEWIC